MSSRMLAMGRMIETALMAQAFSIGGAGSIMTVKQIAELAGVTKATARKYARMMVKEGILMFVENQLRGAETFQYICTLPEAE